MTVAVKAREAGEASPPHADYDTDFYAWCLEQAALIRAGKLDAIDIENVAEEIESLGRSDKRAMRSQLERVLVHLLKWRFQPERRSRSWENSIVNGRRRLSVVLDESPSLNALVREEFQSVYWRSRKEAARQTRLALAAFPERSPFSLEQARDEDYWPGEGA